MLDDRILTLHMLHIQRGVWEREKDAQIHGALYRNHVHHFDPHGFSLIAICNMHLAADYAK